jgi:putative aldouronate transport system permease protein
MENSAVRISKAKTTRADVLKRMPKYRHAYLLILPALVFTFVFSYLPMAGIILAFKDFDIIDGIIKSPWVGFDNFIKIFNQIELLKVIGNTLFYSSVILFGTFPFSILLALLFNEIWSMRFKKVVQTISYMPYFLSWVSVIGLFHAFFSMDGTYNQIMAKIFGSGYEAKNILMDSKYFLPVIFLSNLWKGVGWSSIIYLAAIAGVDPVLYEAAIVDGCGRIRQIWHITLPGIKTTSVIILVMTIGGLFNANFEQIYGFQNVYTQEDTEVISTFIYRQGIQNGQYSLATAFGLTQGLVTVLLILTANAASKKIFEASLW